MSEAPEQAPAPDEQAAVPGNSKKKLILIGAIGGGVLLLLIIVLVLWLALRGGGEDAHKAKSKKPAHPVATEHAAKPAEKKPEAHASQAKPVEVAASSATSAAMNTEAEKLKGEVGDLEKQVQKMTETAAQPGGAAKLAQDIEALKQRKQQLESDKTKLEQGAQAILRGEKRCVFSGDPAKRVDELRLCLGLSSASGSASHADSGPHWSYGGDSGPEYWAKLNPEWKQCADGKVQSPINLVGSYASGGPALQTSYKVGAASVANNGHTIQVNLTDAGGVTLDGKRYNLVQFHFHTPSEEQINGRPADLEAHLVHKSDDGKLLVVAVLLNRGKDNAVLKSVFDALPKQADESRTLAKSFDPAKLLPAGKGFYHYEGSLTTPPCTEGVQWFVMKQIGSLSPGQLQAFTTLYPYNARPVQPVNGREIVEN